MKRGAIGLAILKQVSASSKVTAALKLLLGVSPDLDWLEVATHGSSRFHRSGTPGFRVGATQSWVNWLRVHAISTGCAMTQRSCTYS